MSDEFDFDKFEENFDAMRIMYEEMAKIVVPMFSAYREEGLSVQEAAALTAAMIAHSMPTKPQEPSEE